MTPTYLPTKRVAGVRYFVDTRLNQLRNVDNPHDHHDFNQPRKCPKCGTSTKHVMFLTADRKLLFECQECLNYSTLKQIGV